MIDPIPSLKHGIAIIGMAGRFPGADSVTQLWDNLCQGHEALYHYSPEEVRAALSEFDHISQRFVAPQIASPGWVPRGFRFAGVDCFDAGFFGYPPSEAELLDPQQRLFLECAWAAMEDAGYVPDACPGNTAVFAGATLSRYFVNNIYANREIAFSSRDLTAGIGNETDYIANRVSYKLGLRGPAVNVQSACSTSLVAVHLACQCLHAGEADHCLAGGALVNLPGGGYLYREGSMMSPDGHIRTFDAGAVGTVFSEAGVGAVLLKRYADALAHGDHIYGVILGSAVSNDGNQKAGYTAPGVAGQVLAVSEALSLAGISPRQIGYLEAHGTGTPLGDPVELAALRQAWMHGENGQETGWCALGSLKPNVGHLAAVAGVAGLMKATLAVELGVIPPQINFESPSPLLDLKRSPFHVSPRQIRWDDRAAPRIAAVSSFGIGGTNAHVIVAQAPRAERARPAVRTHLFRLSARTPQALREQAGRLLTHLERHPQTEPGDIALTLRTGRKPFALRRAFAARDQTDLAAALRALAEDESAPPQAIASERGIVWMFSGQGSQYVGMGRGLHEDFDVFRSSLDTNLAILATLLGRDLRPLLFPAPDTDTAASAEALRQTVHAQPILFAFEHAMASQLFALGLEPAAMIGHSMGEYVAACLAGVFTLEAALGLVVERARLMQGLPAGTMLAVSAGAEEMLPRLGADLALAGDNAPGSCVVSGPTPAVAALQETLECAGLGCRRLVTSHAFHSAMMDPILDAFRDAVRRAAPRAPQRPFISNATGTWIQAAEATDPDYWVRHLRHTVRFADGVRTLARDGCAHFMELGPGNTLCQFARRTLRTMGHPSHCVDLVHGVKEQRDDRAFFVEAVGRLWAAGAIVDLPAIEDCPGVRRISLPTYPFARERHWVPAPQGPTHPGAGAFAREPQIADWLYVPSWRRLPPAPRDLPDFSGQSVLLLDGGQPLFERLAERLRDLGATVVRVGPAGAGDGNGTLRIDQPGDYLEVARALPTRQPLAAVIHGLACTGPTRLDAGNWQDHLDLGFFSLMYLVQALIEAPTQKRVALLSVTTEAADPAGEAQNPAKSALHGLHLGIGHEYPYLNSRNLDLPPDAVEDRAQADQVLAELSELCALPEHLTSPQEKNLARRGHLRWAADIVASPQPPREAAAIALRPDALYLVTGGLGALGLTFAEWLVGRGACRLALLGRRALPAQADWEGLIHGVPPQEGRALERLLALHAAGVEIRYVQADAGDAAALAAVVRDLAAGHGPIAGVLHCAGVADSGIIQNKTRARALKVFAPKIAGAIGLCEALEEGPLDFLVLFSSLFSVVGGPGQAAYAGANAVLDAIARDHRQRLGLPLVSLGWGAWSGGGMAAGPREKEIGHPYLDRLRERDSTRAVIPTRLRAEDHWALAEHRIGGESVMPGTALIESLRAAHAMLSGHDCFGIRDLTFLRPLRVPPQGADMELRFSAMDQSEWQVEIHGGPTGAIQPVLVATLVPFDASVPAPIDLDALAARHDQGQIDFSDGQPQVRQGETEFLTLGPHWQCLRRIYLGSASLLGELDLPALYHRDLEQFPLHPALLDMATGPISGYLMQDLDLPPDSEYLPFAYQGLRLRRPLSPRVFTHIERRPSAGDAELVEFDIRLYDPQGATLVEIDGLALKRLPASAFTAARTPPPDDDSIAPEDGLEVFTRLFGHPEAAQWTISPLPLPGLIRHIQSAHNTPKGQAAVRRGGAALDPAATPVQRLLADIFEAALGVSPIGLHDNFFALGGDSVLAIQIVSAAKAAGLTLKPSDLFERQSVAELAALFEGDAPVTEGTGQAPPEAVATTAAPGASADRDWLREAGIADEDIERILRQ